MLAPVWSGEPFYCCFVGSPVVAQPFCAPFSDLITPDRWYGAHPVTFSFRWQRCDGSSPSHLQCGDIEAATGSTYVPVGADVGHFLRIVVTASNAGGSTTVPGPPSFDVSPAPG